MTIIESMMIDKNRYWNYSYQVVIIFDRKSNYKGFLFLNPDYKTRNSTGNRPAYYIDDDLMDWCYENFGPGGNGKFENDIFYQGRGNTDKECTWWIEWSYSHEHCSHFITAHFEKREDAVAFRLKWG